MIENTTESVPIAPLWASAIWPPLEVTTITSPLAPTRSDNAPRVTEPWLRKALHAMQRSDAYVREVLLERCDPVVHSGVLYHDTRPLFNGREYMPQTLDLHSQVYAYALARHIAHPAPHRPGLVRIAEPTGHGA